MRASLAILVFLALTLLSIPARCEDDRAEIRRMLISSCKHWDNCGQYFRPHRQRYSERHIELRSVWRHDRDEDHGRQWRDDRWSWSWNPHRERNPVQRAQRDWERYTTSDPSFRRYRQCHDRIIEVLSDQHKAEETAMRDAWTKWVAAVVFERGNIYQEPNNSIQRWSLCAPTDINDTVTGVVSRYGGKVYGAVRRATTGKEDTRDDGRNVRCRLWARSCPELAEPAETIEEAKDGRDQDRQDRRRQTRRRQ